MVLDLYGISSSNAVDGLTVRDLLHKYLNDQMPEVKQTVLPLQMLGLEPKSTAVRSPESNGIAESFVKTIKRDYISVMPKPDGLTAAKNLAEAFEHYNEWHPHSALGYRSPREYLRQQASNGLSDNRCLEI
ncbi:IS2 transposase Orf2 [Escherichia coli]|nr:transposase [Escherichia coli O177:NM str. 2010C-4558]GCJ86237.1 IS2 transposase Orf2 [Escherichia coli]GCQ80390.1 IS2 transposase Orf2 [Escherichia coli]